MRNRILTPMLLGLMVLASSLGLCAATPNHLAGQKSVYLSRAAQHPLDWYSWSAEAFQRAKELNRPILLDMGAVWCPWCNLMDRETYRTVRAESLRSIMT